MRTGVMARLVDALDNLINPATEEKQDNIIDNIKKLVKFEIPPFDYLTISYIASGNGIGEIEKVIYKTGGSGGIIQATLTLGYDIDNKLSTITKT